MYINGIVITTNKDGGYRGVDSACWDLCYHPKYEAEFEEFYDEYIEKTYWNMPPHSWISACTDLDFIKRYIDVSKELQIPFRILLIKSEIPAPVMQLQKEPRMKFLGYDYAYVGGDFYSAVYNELPGTLFPEIKVNENGLIQTREEMEKYLAQREEFEKNHPPYTLEVGDFAVMELYEIDESDLFPASDISG